QIPARPSRETVPLPADEKRQRILDAALRRVQYRQDALIEVLHTAQNTYGFLSPEQLWYIARQLRVPPSRVYGVASFYNFFTLKPAGLHTVVVCQGTACYIRGSTELARAVTASFGIREGETTPDGQLTSLAVRCLGSCSLAPVAVVDGQIVARAEPGALCDRLRELLAGVSSAATVADRGGTGT
ncbi:MAG TPA: NAD(P)H-dependent oxidoreductase subunit E, partial [Chloroflexota bacterium]|nr:NAD(P)H-dependent oxidoreductase subunit E [Chloroflexota bacterium]